MKKETSVSAVGSSSYDNKNLRVESGETILLSPDSQRFQAHYIEARPRSIEDVRKILGLSEAAAKAAGEQKCCEGSRVPAALVAPEDLASKDPATRFRARNLAYQVAQQYVTSADPSRFKQWTAVMNQYLEISQAVLRWIELQDIVIQDGGTLLLSANTQALYANDVRIHGTGRIVCQGNVTFKFNSLQGIEPLSGVLSSATASAIARTV